MSGYFDRRVDPLRSGLVAVGAVLALIAAYLDATDLTVSFQSIVVPYLLISAFLAGAIAVLPAAQPWSSVRRSMAAIVAIAMAIAVIFVLWLSPAEGCACVSSTPPGWAPPELLGLRAGSWTLVAAIGDPLLLLIAASALPDRLTARRATT